MISGIYKITNLVNDNCYIGSSTYIKNRWRMHQKALENNKHHSQYLQRSYNKHGKYNFIYEILFICPRKDLLRLEQYCINNYKSVYNVLKIAGSNLGHVVSQDTKLKQSLAMKGKKHTDEARRNMSIARKGIVFSKDTLESMRRAKLGKSNPRKQIRVLQICKLTLNVINKYTSLSIAQEQSGVHVPNISKVLSGKRKSAGGFIWKHDN